ncbi:MAG TPA: sigma-70 family RNA polymerase sigma factor [Terriglobales bacterium]|jgi:RNA polymerase sigma-70 factor (ECF subfamily)|nr:sigma-70 family RNA polymerase sigma factor [Terriglobales bacterium]
MMPATENAISASAVPAAEDSETALVHAAKTGDMDAFAQLLRRTQGMVFRIAQHITGSPEDAEEVVQEAFLKAFQNLERFEERSRFSTWVTRITVNTALMRLRVRRGHETVPLSDDNSDDHGALQQEVADWRPDPEQIYTWQELRAILERALDGLPQHYSTVFLLRDVEGFSTAETAEALGLSVTAVKARLLRARLQLRQKLDPYFRQEELKRHANGGR